MAILRNLFFAGLAAVAVTAKQPTKAEGLAWLEAKKKEDGVITLPSGLAYKVLKAGEGKEHPLVGTPCACHYAGTLIPQNGAEKGKEFDSSYKRGAPTTFAPNQVIAGWTEAMQLMVQGDKWEMYIPPNLAYGDRAMGQDIPAGSTLVFTMEIMEIKGATKPKVEL
ncbi:unnamed protein product [Amoebophrya sp. A120]|nr:unnamed protein product [Amoebophrya sp. A120]|eukprot:GSA120T00007161001.1